MDFKQEKRARYDRDKNKVILTVHQEQDIKAGAEVVGSTINTFVQSFEPSHIRKAYQNLMSEKAMFEKAIKQEQEELKLETPVEELEALNKKLQDLQAYNKRKELNDKIEQAKKNLELTKDDLRVFKPVVDQLPKK